MELEGRVALVTGAARRVGRAIALRLAEAGCQVAVHYDRSADEAAATAQACRAHGVTAEALQADFTDAAAAEGLVRRVLGCFDRLDVLVNNAAVFERMSLAGFNLDAWERTLRVNLTTPMALTHAAAEALRRSGGRVINLCDAGTARPWPGHLAYMVSKGGLETLTRLLARALAPEVNVVGIAPGIAAWPPDYDQETRERLMARVPLRRAGGPEDVAAAVHFALSAGDYVTGAILPIDGGRSVV
jgi:NAD(P)-dependent dehydrogenase (short-subunit alcohol dehydrogenase family)